MKNTIIAPLLLACLAALSLSALAKDGDPVNGGWLMARSGAANTAANYSGEDEDINGKLERVSALCMKVDPVNAATVKAFVETDKTRNWGQGPNWWIATVSTATGQGAKVIENPQPRNPNHCLISGLTVSRIKGIWHESPDP